MRKLRNAALVAAISMAAVGVANAGPANAFTFATPTVTTVSERVTYATTTPALVTYVGYDVGNVANNVLLTNTSGSTVNQFTLKFTASVVKTNGSLSQEKLRGLNITSTSDVSSICAFDTAAAANPLTVTCRVQQVRNGGTFPALTVFYLAPSNVDSPANCAGSSTPLADCNTVKTQIDLIYAEGPNDQGPTGVPNSTQTYPATGELKLVSLGTTNPSFVKSALPKGPSGGKIFTGNGVPMAGAVGEFKEFTESIALQPFVGASRYGQASIRVREDDSGDGQCTNLGNFSSCPLYETSIIDPTTGATLQFSPALQFTYRIDASKLKRSLAQILNNTLISYSSTGTGPYETIQVCTNNNGTTNGDGKPCIDMRPGNEPVCFKNTQSAGGIAELKGDCQWNLLKDSNGFVKFN